MTPKALSFEITEKVGIRADFARKRAVISCETKDGKPIHLKADFQTLEKSTMKFASS